jgi:hypothetical protein
VRIVVVVSMFLTLVGVSPAADVARDDGSIDLATAARVAAKHMLRSQPPGTFTVGDGRAIVDPTDNQVLYYHFDLTPQGYVMVPASMALPPVIAYSFTGTVPADGEAADPLHRLLLLDLRSRLGHLDVLTPETNADRQAEWRRLAGLDVSPTGDRGFEQWPPSGSTPTGGWVLTQWNQSSPYNALCPTDPVSHARSVAGCPAVAMAQIVNYHARLNGKQFDDTDDYYHSYAGRNYWIDDDHTAQDFPSFPQLNTYLDSLFDKYHHGNGPDSTERAALIFACGVAARQVYTSGASGTFSVSQAKDAYGKFNCGAAELLYQESVGPYPRMMQNMIDAYPAHLAIVDPTWSSGHNVVVDGYNTNGYYHINFGWSGAYDGWYRLPAELPYSLTVVEGIIVDIMIEPCGPMDCNCDGLVNLHDLDYFVECYSGPAGTFTAPGCTSFDAEPDDDVDLQDFALFQALFGDAAM